MEQARNCMLTYVNGVASIYLPDNTYLQSTQRPILSFSFDTLYYEPHIDHYRKVIQNEYFELTDIEKQECYKYIENFLTTEDYPVHAYNEKNIYVGHISRLKAENRNYKYTITNKPQYPVSKWVDDHWEKVVAIIMNDGTLRKNPDGYCDNCDLFFTEKEWTFIPSQPTPWHIYDAAHSEWVDPRNIEDVLYETQLEIRNYFEALRWKEWGKFIPQYEQLTWKDQVDEAKAYIADDKTQTPYIDTFLQERTDENKPDKLTLCQDIVFNHNNYKLAMARVNARQWNYLKQAESYTTNEELDTFRAEIQTLIQSVGRKR